MGISKLTHDVIVDEFLNQVRELSQKVAHWRAVSAEASVVIEELQTRLGDLPNEVTDVDQG